MQTGMDDARTVFDRLRFDAEKSGSGRITVNVAVFPTADKVVAELRYAFDGTEWAAVVTKEGGDLTSVYRLWYQRGDRFQKSGIFPDGTALVDYLRDQARHKFEGYQPTLDTLDNIRGKSAASMVPECYGRRVQYPKCHKCPYKGGCFAVLDGSHQDRGSAPESNDPQEPEEPEDVFLARLRGKVRAQDWEG